MDHRHKTIQTMTPDTTIEEQARREAEAKYPMDHYTHQVMREAYISALVAERSKPQPSVEEVMEVVMQWLWERSSKAVELRERLTKLFSK